MLFLALGNANVEFTELKKLISRSYTNSKAISTISRVVFIDDKEFAKVGLDKNFKIFLIYINTLEIPTTMPIKPSKIS